MLVSRLRQQIAGYLEVDLPVHLLVGDSWEYDVLEHTGTITDRFFPGTSIPCPFLQQGSRVNVYLARPDHNLIARPFVDANGNEEWLTPRDLIYGRTSTQPIDVDVEELDSAEESTAPMSPTSEDVSDPPLPSRWRKNGERGRRTRRNIDTESVDENLDDIIREQLSEDARQSSSSVAEVPRPRAPSPLSDHDYSARRS